MPTAPRHRQTKAERLTWGARGGGSTCDRFYKSKAWRRLRRELLAINHACETCGDLLSPKEVHHKIPRLERPDLAFKKSNLQVLCKSCHSKETYRETLGVNRGGGFVSESQKP